MIEKERVPVKRKFAIYCVTLTAFVLTAVKSLAVDLPVIEPGGTYIIEKPYTEDMQSGDGSATIEGTTKIFWRYWFEPVSDEFYSSKPLQMTIQKQIDGGEWTDIAHTFIPRIKPYETRFMEIKLEAQKLTDEEIQNDKELRYQKRSIENAKESYRRQKEEVEAQEEDMWGRWTSWKKEEELKRICKQEKESISISQKFHDDRLNELKKFSFVPTVQYRSVIKNPHKFSVKFFQSDGSKYGSVQINP